MSTASTRLPATFTSLYRLFLRTAAASVLYKRPAVRRIRRLWRPAFESGAHALHVIANGALAAHDRARLQRLYCIWEQRVDNTLSLLAISARSRGLPHQVTRNLNFLMQIHDEMSRDGGSAYFEQRQRWNGQLPPESERYKPSPVRVGSRVSHKEAVKARLRELDDQAWGAFGEVILMAEGRDRISFGRVKSR